MATLLISRAQSSWSQDQWSDVSLHQPEPRAKKSPHSTKQNNNNSSGEENSHAMKRGGDSGTNRSSKLLSPFHAHKINYFLSLTSSNSSSQKVVLFVR
jgi:hypothetical protein